MSKTKFSKLPHRTIDPNTFPALSGKQATGATIELTELAARNGIFRTDPRHRFAWAFTLAEQILHGAGVTAVEKLRFRKQRLVSDMNAFEARLRNIAARYGQFGDSGSQGMGAGPLEALAALIIFTFKQPKRAR